MKSKNLANRFINYNKNHFFFVYTFAFLIMAVIGFYPFIKFDCSFVWSPDGTSQHYIALVYWGKYLREIVKSVLAGSLVIPQYDFSIGFGEDILSSLQYYVIGDPLNLLSVAVPSKYTVYLFDFLVVFRLYLSGLAFCALAKYKKQTVYSGVIGALIYVFNAYALNLGARHPFFINPMIYFPLIILGAEMIFDKKRPYLFIFMIFISGISNFYFFYVLTLFTALYILVRLFFVYKKQFIKGFFACLLKFGGCWLLGVAMAALIFIPVSYTFLSASRSGVEYGLDVFYNLRYYQTALSGFAGYVLLGKNTYIGLTVLGFSGIILLFMRKNKNAFLKVSFIILSVFMLFPVFGKIANGFSYVANRWVWAYALLISYIVTLTLSEIRKISFKQAVILGGASLLYCVYMYLTIVARNEASAAVGIGFVSFALGAVIYAALPYIKPHINKKRLQLAWKYFIVASMVFGVFCNTLYAYNRSESSFLSSFATVSNAQKMAFSNGFKKIKNVQNTETAVERYEIDGIQMVDYNNSLINETYGTTEYLSVINNYLNDFQQEMGMVYKSFAYADTGNGDPFLQAVENVKYFAAENPEKTPYGYDSRQLLKVQSNAIEGNGPMLGIHENKNYVPFGYTYQNVISTDEYSALSTADKRNALIQAAVIDGTDEFVNASVSQLDIKSSTYNVTLPDEENGNVRIADEKIHTIKDGVKVKAEIETEPGCQIYCIVKGLGFEDVDNEEATKRVNPEKYENLNDKELGTLRYSDKTRVERFNSFINFSANGKSTTVTVGTPNYDYYSGLTDFTINLGYSDEPVTELFLTFGRMGSYTIDSIQIVCESLDGFEEKTAALSEDTLQDIKIGTDSISGTISTQQDKWLLLTVPYSENWSVYIDGEEAETYRANTAFTAVNIEAGSHTVEMKYSNRTIKYSVPVTAAGFVCFAGVIICWELYNKKRRSCEQG